MIQYLVLNNLNISDASAYNNFYCIGMPSLTSFAGAVDKVRRILENCMNIKINTPKFSVVIHDYSFIEGLERHVRYMNNEGSSKNLKPLKAASAKEEYKCNFICSIIMAFDVENDDDNDFDLDSENMLISDYMENIQNELHFMKICGGRINNEENFSTCFFDNKEMLRHMNNMSNGYFMADYSETFKEYLEILDGDALKTMIYLFTLFEKEDELNKNDINKSHINEKDNLDDQELNSDNNKIKKEKAVSGWITPTNMGFVRLHDTSLDEISELRDNKVPTYFVEALTGVIEYKYSKRLIRKLKSENLFAKMKEENIVFQHKFSKNVYKIVNSKMEND